MKTISQDALAVLSTATIAGSTVTITAGQLERKLYEEVNKALEALGGKWSRKLRAHAFDGLTQDQLCQHIDNVLSTGGFVDAKKELQQFFTPSHVADMLVKMARVKRDHTVLEPSAGSGRIIEALARGGALLRTQVTAVELDHGYANILRGSGLAACIEGDFLQVKPSTLAFFDRIVMNPPFTRQADIAHVLHAWKFLRPGGLLVAVMSAGVTFRQDKTATEFRLFVRRNSTRTLEVPLNVFKPTVRPDGFLTLADGTFADSGTNVSAVVCVLEKPA